MAIKSFREAEEIVKEATTMREKMLHSLNLILGSYHALSCPECGSKDYHLVRIYETHSKIYSNGADLEDEDYQYIDSEFRCPDCDYRDDIDDRIY